MVSRKGGKWRPIKEYFQKQALTSEEIDIRGKKKEVEYVSARLTIKSHGERMHVVAMRYRGEKDLRYIVCTDLTFRAIDIIRHYGLRWLVEVVNKEWKQYSGFGKRACQYGVEGARCGALLSLLGVCLFLLHPKQLLLARKGQPLCTAGSLSRRMMIDYFFQAFERMLEQDDPHQAIECFKTGLDEAFVLKPSKQHPSGSWYPETTAPDSLKSKFGAEQERKLEA
jgi:hypothetical protein